MLTEKDFEQMREVNKCYWRILKTENKLCIVEMQNFDEYDYDQKKFITEQRFDTEEQAREFLDKEYFKALTLVRLYENTF